MISVSFYCTIISLSKILGYTDLTGVCVVCVRGSQLLSLIILELEYFGWLTLQSVDGSYDYQKKQGSQRAREP